MKRYLLLFIILSNAFCIECFEGTGWCYNQSVNFAFYIFEEVSINDTELNRGILEYDGTVSCPNNDCDVVILIPVVDVVVVEIDVVSLPIIHNGKPLVNADVVKFAKP